MISYPGLTIEQVGYNLVLSLDAVSSDDGETPRPTTHVVHNPPLDEPARTEAIYKAVCELALHEVSEWFRVDGVRWRAPHPEQPTHHQRIYLKAADYALVRSCCVLLLDHFACPVEVLLVGSALERPTYHDIDVRFRIPAERYRTLPLHARGLSFLLTEFARQFTSLPVDIQVQPDSAVYEGRPSIDLIGYRGSSA